jgi:glycosyltransferase involved in cell wall biosynthesis
VAFPTKLAEYLAAGRPIIVHAPSYATAASYVREHDCGVVVDRPDVEALVEAIDQLLGDDQRASELGLRSRQVARENHDRRDVVARFRRELAG